MRLQEFLTAKNTERSDEETLFASIFDRTFLV